MALGTYVPFLPLSPKYCDLVWLCTVMLASPVLARVHLVSCDGTAEGIIVTLSIFHSFLMLTAVSMEVCDVFYSKYNL